MKYIPIIFSTAMVHANHAGRKNQTRRVLNPVPLDLDCKIPIPAAIKSTLMPHIKNGYKHLMADKEDNAFMIPECPYGQVGDVLWVREAFAHTKQLNLAPDDENYGFVYKADDESILWNDIEGWRWRPSIRMPIEACRSWCVITDIECQRLQHITEWDAIGEGIERELVDDEEGNPKMYYYFYPCNDYRDDSHIKNVPKTSFYSLWSMIHGYKNNNSWEANPWVWVVRYEHTTIQPAGWDEHVKAVTAKRRGK